MLHGENEIGAFLKARRAALDPAEVGLPEGPGRRRVRGLRREEVAQLAAISVAYYTRIEQGRAPAVSDAVLDALARALRLTDGEAAYLRNIAGPRRRTADRPRGTRAAAPARTVRPEIRQLLDAMDPSVAAVVVGRGLDILAWNGPGGRLSFDLDTLDPARRNTALLVFLHPAARERYPDWEKKAEEIVGSLRADSGRHPDDRRICEVVNELLDRSPDFRRMWAAQGVSECLRGTKRIRHPQAGELTVTFESFRPAADPDHMLVTYTAPRGSESEARLRELGRTAGAARAARSAPPAPALTG
ncbi:helix-turn-helix transcriptional regulator [Streptomyces sp. RS10V-4]|uniref:helix-turn-helix transcriptional regulator n=1 Tax=Streptomyces rhizoryzae TaxID=2932493 RepID=UPI00200516B3|nr:helix-turn-helix transcriptional regulator [Streptomyces rhizoryzae]MCK7624616.1 helix-turn-helix transcriptional regulator [Streptomyces rhizoryzae]